ncbi:S9 family peptidase [Kaistella palustris]|uniref:S9 family peptidase n=1 Tax=Kaistella palustris TaxID=493376 RepID=UPI00040E586E|nr:prolyl oligopeptidase family serine peptidase [Kaistella palustris]
MKQPINIKLLLISLFLCSGLLPAQQKTDSLEQWIAGFANFHNLRSSPGQRWVMASKSYPSNRDTLQVFDTGRPGKAVLNLVKMNVMQNFMGEKALLVQGQGIAEYIVLPDIRRVQYSNVIKTAVLTDLKEYVILDETNVLTLYDENAGALVKVQNVKDFVSDGKRTVAAVVEESGMFSIVRVAASNTPILYQSPNRIAAVSKFKTADFAAFTETEQRTGKMRCVLIDIGRGRTFLPQNGTFTDATYLQVAETPDGKAFLINLVKRVQPMQNAVVNLWYGNDRYLREKEKGRDYMVYLLWKKDDQRTETLPAEYDAWLALTSRYFVAFNRAEQLDYRFTFPVFPLYLFDRVKGTVKKIADASRVGAVSPDGKTILIKEEIGREWILWEVGTGKKYKVGLPEVSKPCYTSDGKYILFESENGLGRYDLGGHRFLPLLLRGQKTRILLKQSQNLYEKDEVDFTVSSVNVKEGMVVQTYSKKDRKSGLYRISGDQVKQLISGNTNYIRQLLFTPGFSTAVTIEESYKTKPAVFLYDLSRDRKISLSSAQPPQVEEGRRQEVISYLNSRGRELTGTLYYPENFRAENKYPMVVHIYQEQGEMVNKYPFPGYGDKGYNIRMLTKNGYIVFLPDTVLDDRGTGISALDCVNSGMDALAGNPNIDFGKVGLIGHSFGGYETNFIAGHSVRFRAYISGAGISNLTQWYFSYNPSYQFFEYSRIETGQFEMQQSFSEAKDKYIANNPIYFADKVSAPMLLWTGMKDSNLPPNQTSAFYTALVRNKKDVIALFYPTQNHVLAPGTPEIRDLHIRTMEWWDYFLKDRKDVGWIQQQMKKDAL